MKYLIRSVFAVCLLAVSSISNAAEQINFLVEDDPFQVNDKREPYSATIDITKEIIKRVGMKETLTIVPWARGYEMAKNGPNVALLVGARTAERESLFKWVGPLDRVAMALYAKKDSGINLSELEQAKAVSSIGCVRNTVECEILTGMGFSNLEEVTTQENNIKKLMAGRVKLIPQSLSSMSSAMQSAGFKLEDVELAVMIEDTQLYMVVSKDVPDTTVQMLQNALDDMKQSGMFNEFFIKNNQPIPVF